MDRVALDCFVALAEELHFHRAAERCHISQPAMSQQIRKLEAEIGVRLAHRTKRVVTLTGAGEVFLAEARKTIRQMDLSVELAQRTDRGEIGQLTVGVTAPALFMVFPEIVARFRLLLPHVGLVIREMTTADQEKALMRGDLDIGIVHPPLEETSLRTEQIGRAAYQLAIPEGHRLAGRESVSLSELDGEPVVIFPREIAPQMYDAVLVLCQEAGSTLKIAMEAFPAQSIIAMVASGVGLGFIASETQRLTRAGVVYRPVVEPRPHLSIGVAYHADGIDPASRTFLTAARQAGRAMR